MTKKKMKLQNKFMISIFLLILIPLILVPIVGYNYSATILSTKLEELATKDAESVVAEVNKIAEDMITASNVINLDDKLQKYIIEETNKDSILAKNKYIIDGLNSAVISSLYLYDASMIFIDFKGNIYNTNNNEFFLYDDIVKETWFEETIAKNGFFNWHSPSENVLNFNSGITLTRVIRSINGELGVLVVHVDDDNNLRKLLCRDSDYLATERYLVNENMEIILTNKKIEELEYYDLIKNNRMDEIGQDMLISMAHTDKIGCKLIQISPRNEVLEDVSGYRNFIITVNSVFLVLMLLVSYIIAKQITKAINQLNYSVQHVIDGNLDTKVDVNGSFEVEQLGKNFNLMIDKINYLIDSVRKEEEEKIKYKLEALQSQINPHFLLNTLNGIKWLCVIESAKTSEEMLKSLGYILEKTLYLKSDLIAIADEVKCVEHYIKIQKMRYGKRFEINYNIEPETLNYYIPSLLLQPIIENSIIHGFEMTEFGGVIDISILSKGDYIEIIIQDNGKGMDKDFDYIINNNREKDKYDSIGLSNVYFRINLNYNEPCGIKIESEKNKGTKTIILLNKIEQV